MALQSSGTSADIIAHGGNVSNASGSKGDIRIKTNGYMQFHNGSRWITDGSQVVYGNGEFRVNGANGVKKTVTSRNGSANLATNQTRTSTYEFDTRTVNGWVGDGFLANAGAGKIFAAANCDNRSATKKASYNVSSVSKLGVGIMRYNLENSLPSNKVGLAYQSDLSSAEVPYGTPTTNQVTIRGTLNKGQSADATDSGFHLSLIKFL
jgi:hypothetical protein